MLYNGHPDFVWSTEGGNEIRNKDHHLLNDFQSSIVNDLLHRVVQDLS